jgi:hypothetical protein
MLKKILKYAGVFLLIVLAIAILLLIWFNIPVRSQNDNAKMGVTFSSRYASDIGLDWKEAYLATLDDLKARKIRLPIYWDLVEKEEGKYDFSDLDWQLEEAKKRNADVILAVGQKVPRWPECFIPEWTKDDTEKKKGALLKFIAHTIERYKDNSAVEYWQIENEPFLKFGVCPPLDVALLDSEIAVARSADPTRQIIITDSGELSLWFRAAKRADVFGTTMYRTIWKEGFGYFTYPIGPRFFQFKHWLNRIFAGNEKAIVIELQGEPWVAGWTVHAPLETQFSSMNADILKDNIVFARKVGFPEIYVWGVEWWYWLKKTQNHPELWDTAREFYDIR